MRAAQINQYGDKDVLQTVTDAPKPVPAAGEVLVEVHAASVNPFDWKIRAGYVQSMAILEFPATLGGDMSGVVADIGEGVEGFKVGQAVYGQANALGGQGSFAELAPVKAGSLATKPSSVDFVGAAALPLAAVSAYQALADTLHVSNDQRILIHGGAGGIGAFAIQLAKHLGAYVVTTAAQGDIEYVKELGADEVIDYKSKQFQDVTHDIDAVFDTAGGDAYKQSFTVMKPGGQIISMVEQPDESLMQKYGVTATAQFTHVTTERLRAVGELVDSGVLKVTIDKVFLLDEAAEAVEHVHSGHGRGKVVLKIKA